MRSPRWRAATMESNIVLTTSSALPFGNFRASDNCSIRSLLVTGMIPPSLVILGQHGISGEIKALGRLMPDGRSAPRASRLQGARRLVFAEHAAQHIGDLADGGERLDRADDGGQEIRRAARGVAEGAQGPLGLGRVAPRPRRPHPRDLVALERG